MARIALILYPETGHLMPTLKLAKGLKSRGHSVAYFALADFEEKIRSEGLEFIPILKELCPKGFVGEQAVKKGLLAFKALLMEANKNARAGFSLIGELSDSLRQERLDLLLVDNLLPDVALAAKTAGIPCVLLNTQLFSPWENDAAYKALLDLPELVLCPAEFDFPREQRKKQCHNVEASIDLVRTEPAFPWDKVDPERPLMYCALGTMSHSYEQTRALVRSIIEAVADRPKWQLILAGGPHCDPASFGPVPFNVLIVPWAPQLQILKKASLMISHGGFNSVKECIFFGVPMILFPIMGDHPAVTARVQYHGLGLRGSIRSVSSRQIGSLIDTVTLQSSFKTRIELMREKFVEAEKSQRGIHAVESLLAKAQSQAN